MLGFGLGCLGKIAASSYVLAVKFASFETSTGYNRWSRKISSTGGFLSKSIWSDGSMPDIPVMFRASLGDLLGCSNDSIKGMLWDWWTIIFIVFVLNNSG